MLKTSVADKPLLTTSEVCRALRCGRGVVEKLRASGRLRAARHFPTTPWLYFAESVAAYLAGLGMRAEAERILCRPRRSPEEAHQRAIAARARRGRPPLPGRSWTALPERPVQVE
jgi:hypothetical protein